MIEVWKRREAELGYIWNMKGYVGNDAERPDYKFEHIVDPLTKKTRKVSFINSYLRRIFIELPVVTISLTFVVLAFILYQYVLNEYGDPP